MTTEDGRGYARLTPEGESLLDATRADAERHSLENWVSQHPHQRWHNDKEQHGNDYATESDWLPPTKRS